MWGAGEMSRSGGRNGGDARPQAPAPRPVRRATGALLGRPFRKPSGALRRRQRRLVARPAAMRAPSPPPSPGALPAVILGKS